MRNLADPRGGLCLRAAPAREPRRREHGGHLLALRDVGARAGVGVQLHHRGQRGDLCRSTGGIRRRRSQVRTRLRLPYLMEQAGGRAVYEPEAVAVEKPAAETEDEYGRKVPIRARSATSSRGGPPSTRPLYARRAPSRIACCGTRPVSSTSACSCRTSLSSLERRSIAASSRCSSRASDSLRPDELGSPFRARGLRTTTTS